MTRGAGLLMCVEYAVSARLSSHLCYTTLVIIDGESISWNQFGRMLMQFEGWNFRLDALDASDEDYSGPPDLGTRDRAIQ